MSVLPPRDDRAFGSPIELLSVFVVPGIALGIAFHELGESFAAHVAAGRGVAVIAVLVAVGLIPLLFWFTTGVGQRLAALVFAVITGGLLAGGNAWSAQRFGIDGRIGVPIGLSLALTLPAAFVIAPFFGAVRAEGADAPYAGLFRRAWNQAVIGVIGATFCGAVLLLNQLVIALFKLVAIDLSGWLHDDRWLAGLAGGALAGAIGMAREQEHIVHALRGLLLALVRSLLPVHLLIVVTFLVAALVRGPAMLDTGLSVTGLLLAVVALAATFIAAALGDGVDAIAPRWRRFTTRLLAALVLPLSGLAAWTLWLRIDQHGTSVPRVVAGVLVLLAVGHGIGYLVAALRPTLERVLARTNTAMALLAVALAALMLTPVGDPVTLSVRNQLARAAQGSQALERLDLGWLAFSTGQPGRAALERVRTWPQAAEPAFTARLAQLDASDSVAGFRRATRGLEASPQRRRLERALQAGTLRVHVRQGGVTRRIDSLMGASSANAAAVAARGVDPAGHRPQSPEGITALLLKIDARTRFASNCETGQRGCTVIVSDERSLIDGRLTAMAVSRYAGARWRGEQGLATLLWYTADDAGDWTLFNDDVPESLALDDARLDDWFADLASGDLPLRTLSVQGLQIGDVLLVPDGQAPGND